MRRLIGVLKLDGAAYSEINDDNQATVAAFLVAIVAGAIGSLPPLLDNEVSVWTWGISAFSFMTVFVVLAAFLVRISGRVFGGTGQFSGLVRTLGFAMAPQALGVVPALGIVGFVWTIATSVVATRESHNLTTGQAIGAVAGPAILLMVIAVMAATVFSFVIFGSVASVTE